MDEIHALHRSVGEIGGKLEMLISSVEGQSVESRKSRAEIHAKIESIQSRSMDASRDVKALRQRIDIMEPVVQDYAFLKQRWKAYLAIIILIWGLMSGIFAPIVGGFLQKVLFGF
jgi:hypothetical protein